MFKPGAAGCTNLLCVCFQDCQCTNLDNHPGMTTTTVSLEKVCFLLPGNIFSDITQEYGVLP